MDISKEYILMCEKTTEIQNHDEEYHDWFVCATHYQVQQEDNGSYFCDEPNCPDSYGRGNKIWLPRQDQLQEMVMGYKAWSHTLTLDVFQYWRIWRAKEPKWTPEQLWLAFVMKEIYSKTWNDTNWISIR